MTRKVWFQVGIAILLTILIIRFGMEIQFIFTPFVVIAKTILIPVIFGGALFYLAEPIQGLLEKRKVPRWASISIIVLGMSIVITLAIMIVAPKVNAQVSNLIDNIPAITEKLNTWRIYVVDEVAHLPDQVSDSLESAIGSFESSAGKIGSSVFSFIQSVTSAVVALVMVPFFFIFMLKDHEKFAPRIYGLFKGDLRAWIKKTLDDVNQVLRSYIQGQMIISLLLATLLLIGYSIVGLEYALLLAIFALFMNVIPFLGPWIAFVPAATVALIQDPTMFIWVSLITLIAQQIDSHLITPNIMGKSLDIHPLTVITLLFAAGSLAGFFGILLAIPTYAVIRAVVRNIYQSRDVIKQTIINDVSTKL